MIARLPGGQDNHHKPVCAAVPPPRPAVLSTAKANEYYNPWRRGIASRLPLPHLESALPKPPNYKQEKKRREDMQKKKREAKQRDQAARKENAPPPQKP